MARVWFCSKGNTVGTDHRIVEGEHTLDVVLVRDEMNRASRLQVPRRIFFGKPPISGDVTQVASSAQLIKLRVQVSTRLKAPKHHAMSSGTAVVYFNSSIAKLELTSNSSAIRISFLYTRSNPVMSETSTLSK